LGKWECYRCSHIFEGDSPPEECPNCHYSLTFWLEHVEDRPVTARNYVKTDFLRVEANESAWDAAVLMRENKAGSVIVTLNGVPTGIVTERDILYKIAAEDLPASKVLLKKIMTSPLISVPADTPINEALMLMAKHHIRHLVVTESGKPIGMISQRSVIGDTFQVARPLERPDQLS
jgi:CBS domain-containing protein